MSSLLKRFSFIFVFGLSICGCNYFATDDECYAIEFVESCAEFDTMLEYCNADNETYAPGCYVEERCTDNTETKGDDDDTESSSESDTDSSNRACSRKCVGDIVPCEVMAPDECSPAVYCQWYTDPTDIEDQF